MLHIPDTSLTIDYLKNHEDLIVTCAQWSFEAWGHLTPGKTLEDYIVSRKEYALSDTVPPFTLVALDKNIPVGMCSLAITRDVIPDLSPWLTTLFVIPHYRKMGIGSLLEKVLCSKAAELGYTKIYCFTSEEQTVSWYEKRGWALRETRWYKDHTVAILEKTLSEL